MALACTKVLLVFSLLHLLATALPNRFLNPPDSENDLSETYTIGEDIQLEWYAHIDFVTLTVSHWGSDEVLKTILFQASNPASYLWTVGYNDSIDHNQIAKSPNFVFKISDPWGQTGTTDGFVNNTITSRAFVIKSNETTSTTSTSSNIHAPSSTSSSAPDWGSSNLPTAAKAGIGVGAAAGGLMLVAIGVSLTIFVMRRRNHQYSQRIPDGFYVTGAKAPTLDEAGFANPTMLQPELDSMEVDPKKEKTEQTIYKLDGMVQSEAQPINMHNNVNTEGASELVGSEQASHLDA